MGKRYCVNGIKCPWHKGSAGQMIYCEGIAKGSTTHQAFANREDFLNYRKDYCKNCWKACPMAQMLSDLETIGGFDE